jgi:hypothetical protein
MPEGVGAAARKVKMAGFSQRFFDCFGSVGENRKFPEENPPFRVLILLKVFQN